MKRFALGALIASALLSACASPDQMGGVMTSRMETSGLLDVTPVSYAPAVVGARPDNDDMRFSFRAIE